MGSTVVNEKSLPKDETDWEWYCVAECAVEVLGDCNGTKNGFSAKDNKKAQRSATKILVHWILSPCYNDSEWWGK